MFESSLFVYGSFLAYKRRLRAGGSRSGVSEWSRTTPTFNNHLAASLQSPFQNCTTSSSTARPLVVVPPIDTLPESHHTHTQGTQTGSTSSYLAVLQPKPPAHSQASLAWAGASWQFLVTYLAYLTFPTIVTSRSRNLHKYQLIIP